MRALKAQHCYTLIRKDTSHFQPSSINAENFCVLLMLADLYHITTLKNSAIGFFKRFAKYNEPMKLNEWKKLLDYPDLMAELFSA